MSRSIVSRSAALAFVCSLVVAASAHAAPRAHMVFFELAEPTAANRDALAAKCLEHLGGHAGTLSFSVGVAPGEPSPADGPSAFHVALHLVFDGPAALQAYNDHPRHQRFVAEAKQLWSGVKVFDSDLVTVPAAAEQATPAAGSGERD